MMEYHMTQAVYEPGDRTRYEFAIMETSDGWHVVKQNGSGFAHTFSRMDLIELRDNAAGILNASYDGYRDAVESSAWAQTIADKAFEAKHNPWTYMAALIAAYETALATEGRG